MNLDTVRNLTASGELAIYGEATRRDILEASGILDAQYLLVTIPDLVTRTVMILAAKDLNPDIRVLTRARYLQERAWLSEVGADEICTEEAETALGLAVLLLREVGADEDQIRLENREHQTRTGHTGPVEIQLAGGRHRPFRSRRGSRLPDLKLWLLGGKTFTEAGKRIPTAAAAPSSNWTAP